MSSLESPNSKSDEEDEQKDSQQQQGMSIMQLKRTIVDISSRIFRVLGPGFREMAYEKALEVELNIHRIPYLCQAPVPIYYMNQVIAMGYSDIIVDQRLVLELKAAKTAISPGHLNQCRGYMRSLHIEHGLVINFPQYKPRTSEIDVFDCYLGSNYPLIPISSDVQVGADAGKLGPGINAEIITANNIPLDTEITHYEKAQMPFEDAEEEIHVAPFSIPTDRPLKKTRVQPTNEVESWFEFSTPDGTNGRFSSKPPSKRKD